MPPRKIIPNSNGGLFEDTLGKSTYKAKPKVFIMPEWLTNYIIKRDKCLALSKEGYTDEQIKVMLKL